MIVALGVSLSQLEMPSCICAQFCERSQRNYSISPQNIISGTSCYLYTFNIFALFRCSQLFFKMSVSDAASPTQKCNTHVWEQNISLGMTYSEQTRGGSTPSPGPLEDGCSDSVLREEYLDRQQTIGIRESVKTKDESSVEYGRTQDRRSLSGTVYGPPIGAPPGHYKRPAPVGTPRLQINHTGGLNFKKGELNSVIEVLLDEPRISVPSRYRKNSVISTDSGRGSSLVELAMVQQNPKRIRIRSSALLKILETVAESAGHSFLTSGTVSLVGTAAWMLLFKYIC